MSKRKFVAPMYTATSAMNAHADMVPRAKRLTLTEVLRQMAALRANIARIDMRLSKAEASGEAVKVGKLLEIQGRSRAQFLSLVRECERLGGTMVKQEG